jgi:hypothetical protein
MYFNSTEITHAPKKKPSEVARKQCLPDVYLKAETTKTGNEYQFCTRIVVCTDSKTMKCQLCATSLLNGRL